MPHHVLRASAPRVPAWPARAALVGLALGACGPNAPPDAGTDVGPVDAPPIAAEVNVTTPAGERLASRAGVVFAAGVDGALRFEIDDTVEHQTIAGFGASFLEAGLVTLRTLPTDAEEDAVLRQLFDPETGAGFSAMKTVIGGTDFQSQFPEWFTYHDTPSDETLPSFSVARDFEPAGVGTFIRRARANGGDFVLQATMDFPPDWMLVGDHPDGTVDPAHYDDLSAYYVRFLQAYEAEGIHVDYLSPFNEPTHYTLITAPEMQVLLRDHTVPAMEAAGVTTELMLGETAGREQAADWFPPLVDDPALGPSIAAVAFHGYDFRFFDRVLEMHDRWPSLPLWQTEICCMPLAPRFTFGDLVFYAEQLIRDVESGVSAWLYWNMILDETGGPWAISPPHRNPDGNFQPALVTIDRTTHEVDYTGPFWGLAHFSRYVRPGAVRIETTPTVADGVRVISFRDAGSIIVVLLNTGAEARSPVLIHRGRGARIDLPGSSIATVRVGL